MPSVLRGCVRAPPRAPRAGQGVRLPAAGARRSPRVPVQSRRESPAASPGPTTGPRRWSTSPRRAGRWPRRTSTRPPPRPELTPAAAARQRVKRRARLSSLQPVRASPRRRRPRGRRGARRRAYIPRPPRPTVGELAATLGRAGLRPRRLAARRGRAEPAWPRRQALTASRPSRGGVEAPRRRRTGRGRSPRRRADLEPAARRAGQPGTRGPLDQSVDPATRRLMARRYLPRRPHQKTLDSGLVLH